MPRWSHATYAVQSVPNWKIFVFGGVGGEITDTNRQGIFMNDISIFDTGTERWMHPNIQGDPPLPRGDTQLEYYQQVGVSCAALHLYYFGTLPRLLKFCSILSCSLWEVHLQCLCTPCVYSNVLNFSLIASRRLGRVASSCYAEGGRIDGSAMDSRWTWVPSSAPRMQSWV